MRKVNSYVKIYQERLKMKKKVEKKEEAKEKEEDEEINLNYELPIIISPYSDQGNFNGINFENLPDWEYNIKEIDNKENYNMRNNDNEIINEQNFEEEKYIQNDEINDIIFEKNEEKSEKININSNNDNNNNFYDKSIKKNNEYLLFNKFSQKPILELSNPYNKNSIQKPSEKYQIENMKSNNYDNNINYKENTDINNIKENIYTNKKDINFKNNYENKLNDNDLFNNIEYEKEHYNKNNINENYNNSKSKTEKQINKEKILPKNLNESDLITCSLSDNDTFNITNIQMKILNKEVNQLYKKYNKKNSKLILSIKHPYLDNRSVNYLKEKKKILEPLIKKQKEILLNNLTQKKNKIKYDISKTIKSIELSNNSKGDFITQIQNYNNSKKNIKVNLLSNENSLYNSFNNISIQKNYNKNLPNINNSINKNKIKFKKLIYKPYTIKEYKEICKNYNYRFPSSLGNNIGSPQWIKEHKQLEKKIEYSKSVKKIILKNKSKINISRTNINKSEEISKLNNKNDEFNDSLEIDNQTNTENQKSKFKTKLNLLKLPSIPKHPIKKKINEKNNEKELNKILSENRELNILLFNHNLYNTEVEKIKQSL